MIRLIILTLISLFLISGCMCEKTGPEGDNIPDEILNETNQPIIDENADEIDNLDNNINETIIDPVINQTIEDNQTNESEENETIEELPEIDLENELEDNFELVDFSDYPEIFKDGDEFNGKLVSANGGPPTDVITLTSIMTNLMIEHNVLITDDAIKMSDEINDTYEHNMILVGSPCQHKHMENIFGDSFDSRLCDGYSFSGIPEDQGLLVLIEKNDKFFLIVTGYEASNTRAAGQKLIDEHLSGKNVILVD